MPTLGRNRVVTVADSVMASGIALDERSLAYVAGFTLCVASFTTSFHATFCGIANLTRTTASVVRTRCRSAHAYAHIVVICIGALLARRATIITLGMTAVVAQESVIANRCDRVVFKAVAVLATRNPGNALIDGPTGRGYAHLAVDTAIIDIVVATGHTPSVLSTYRVR